MLMVAAAIVILAQAPPTPASCDTPPSVVSTNGTEHPAAAAPAETRLRTEAPISWSAARPLRWSDFRGKVPATAAHSAETATTLRMQAAMKIVTTRSGTQWECVVTLRELTTEALFEPGQSWVRPAHKSGDLLAHEQLHFDLAHIQARRAATRAARELAPLSFTARAQNEELAVSTARAKFDRALDRFTREEQDALSGRNRSYDADTGHGTKGEEQERWAKLIERELRELGAARRARRS